MKYAAIALFIGFIGMAVFGFSGMLPDSEHGRANCIAMAVNQAACPESIGIFAFSAFHTSAFKKFSTAVFASFLILIFLTALALSPDSVFKKPVFGAYGFVSNFSSFTRTDNFLKWLSFHEASPHLI
ncbi:MAG: hypothetical protein HYS78_01980 [Parcubacteria group bacterium]|nr:hypothetical protein [Parcubacteria group bacterium]